MVKVTIMTGPSGQRISRNGGAKRVSGRFPGPINNKEKTTMQTTQYHQQESYAPNGTKFAEPVRFSDVCRFLMDQDERIAEAERMTNPIFVSDLRDRIIDERFALVRWLMGWPGIELRALRSEAKAVLESLPARPVTKCLRVFSDFCREGWDGMWYSHRERMATLGAIDAVRQAWEARRGTALIGEFGKQELVQWRESNPCPAFFRVRDSVTTEDTDWRASYADGAGSCF